MELQCEMEKEKETKGTFRYREKGEEEKQIIRTLYIQKTAFEREVPKVIKVTIESLQ